MGIKSKLPLIGKSRLEEIKLILRDNKISITQTRIEILDAFLQQSKGIEYNYLLQHPELNLNRITLFRNLKLLARKKIIYKIPSSDGISRYIIQTKANRQRLDNHSSFRCERCGMVISLNLLASPKVELPDGFKRENTEIVMSGLCSKCRG